MKVAVPGRAMKMDELPRGAHLSPILKPTKIPFHNIEIRPPFDYLSLRAGEEGGARGLEGSTLLPLPSSSNINKTIHYNNSCSNNKGWRKTARFYKKELKSKGNIRPSTAVRRHVKKISEEFTMTQVKYENTVSTETKDKNQTRATSSSSSSANNNKSAAKNASSKANCTKSESASKPSSKAMMAPLISPISATLTKASSARVPNGRSKSGPPREAGSPVKKSPSSLTPPARPKHSSGGRCAGGGECGSLAPPTSPAPHRSPGRRTLSLTGVSPRSKQVSFEQIKKVKMFTEKAILEGRVFSIFGYFPAIRDALRRRGWVEKMQHNVPYLNPHPNNCVCPHVGYQAAFLGPPHAHHTHPLNQPTGTAQSTPTSVVASPRPKQEENEEEETGKIEDVKDSTKENESCTSTPNTSPPTTQPSTNSSSLPSSPPSTSSPPLPPSQTAAPSPSLLPPAPSSPPASPPSSTPPSSSSSLSSSLESEDLKVTTATVGSSSADEVVSAQTNNPYTRDTPASHSDGAPSVTPATEESSSTVEGSATNQDAAPLIKPVDRINTATLGPSEVRRGLAESITEKNATIYKYNIKHVPMRRAPRPRSVPKEEPVSEGTKDNEETQDAEEKEEPECTKELEEEAEEGEEEEAKERVPTPEPYNPYVDFVVSEVDLPLIARLLRNVEPNLLWTCTRDSISFKHLSREQVVNRFPNTPFTTKSSTFSLVITSHPWARGRAPRMTGHHQYGLCETLQQLHWFSEAAGVDTFVPRGYCIGHEDERTAFIHDYRLTACLNMLKWLTERSDTHGPSAVADPYGEHGIIVAGGIGNAMHAPGPRVQVPVKRLRQALGHVEQYIQSCCHDDLDAPSPPSLREHEWVALLAAHNKIVHANRKVKMATPNQLQAHLGSSHTDATNCMNPVPYDTATSCIVTDRLFFLEPLPETAVACN
ncbi:Tubulin glycylase 3A [Chionoecetes opilio]|uniref:Tubulin glycylase 3A n=1 Tax=Chionoecetes opilio TaxID=41210 RepID=A0A8J4Y0N7_CHIOP|nr:Tubulin glycylase 3A [Chionoecetes opilio]